jgi:Holliday junction DNA helicase RuvA
MSLFGFTRKDELNCFKQLINISGIGPKGALAILSALSIDELRIAVLSEDYKAIAKANGVGAKTAQRVVIELKDKIKLEDISYMNGEEDLPTAAVDDTMSEAAQALVALGYSNVEALRAIRKVKDYEKLSVEELLKEALKKMF